MIEMDRNNVGLFRWNARSSLRDAAPCNQPGNRQLRSNDGNRGIDCNTGRLVHGEILRHLRAIGACMGFRRVRGIPILFAGVSFIHGNLQREDDRSPCSGSKNTTFFCTVFEEIETFDRNRQFQSFSTSRRRVIARRRHLEIERDLPPIRKALGRVLRLDGSGCDVATPLSRADSHYLAEGTREGGLIAEARLNCYVRNRRGRLPK
jgi:hypothetical protein